MKNYLIYRNGQNELTRTVQRVAVRTMIQVSFDEANSQLTKLKADNPGDVFQLVSAQFKLGASPRKLDKYVRRNGRIVTDRRGRPVGRVNRFSIIHNVKTEKIL